MPTISEEGRRTIGLNYWRCLENSLIFYQKNENGYAVTLESNEDRKKIHHENYFNIP